jgi:hypothetical protein
VTDLATLTVRLEAEIGKYQANLEKATNQLKKFTSDQSKLLDEVTGRLAAFFTVDKAAEWGKEILANADHMYKFSQSTGVAVEDLSRLTYAMKASGAATDNFDLIFKSLNKTIAEAAGNAKSASGIAFKQMGIDVKDATGRLKSADTVISEVADKFSNYADGATKSALATALFGKQGDTLIPFLNQGADGVARLEAEADKLGATLDANTAKAAEEFNSRLDRLKTTLFEGIGNRIAKDLLPTLNALGSRWEENGRAAEVFDNIARELATGLRLLVSAGIVVGNIFTSIGRAIGAVAAAIVEVVQGNFTEAGQIITDYYDDTKKETKEAWGDIKTTWADGSDDLLEEVKVTVKKIKEQAPNLAGGVELQTAIDKALKKLKDFATQLADQVGTFNQTEQASVKYRLETGDLAESVRLAGAEGKKYVQVIEDQAAALQKLKDTKQIEDALGGINAEILKLQGNTSEAMLADFNAKNALLFGAIRRAGDEDAEKQLQTLIRLQTAVADYNDLQEKAQRIEADLAATEERLRNSREAGGLTELQLQGQLSEARGKAATDLKAIADEQTKIAAQTGDPKMLENTKRLTDQVAELRAQTDLLEKSIRNNAEGAFGTFLKDFVKDVHSAGEAFGKFIDTIANQLLDLATQALAQQIFGSLFGTTSSGGGGGGGGGVLGNIFGAIAGAFAGGGADGKNTMPGMAYKVNEKTPRSEWFVPNQAGKVVPTHKMGGQQITQQFAISAPQGSVSRQTQLQIAAAAAKGLASANQRNN